MITFVIFIIAIFLLLILRKAISGSLKREIKEFEVVNKTKHSVAMKKISLKNKKRLIKGDMACHKLSKELAELEKQLQKIKEEK